MATETTALPFYLADALQDLDVMIGAYIRPGMPAEIALQVSSARAHLAALQTLMERIAAAEDVAEGDA